MNDAEILNPKSMVPNCAELWEWYKLLSIRLREHSDMIDYGPAIGGVNEIADEIDAHTSEIEYLTRM
jgi:hypothetical protein